MIVPQCQAERGRKVCTNPAAYLRLLVTNSGRQEWRAYCESCAKSKLGHTYTRQNGVAPVWYRVETMEVAG